MEDAMTNAIGYIRVSTESQIDGGGLDVQRDSITAYADTNALELVAIYTDAGISGSEDVEGRQGLADAIDALHNGTATVLIVPKLDRLARSLMVQESILADIWKSGATVVPCVEGERLYCQPDNPDDPSRTLIRQVLGAVAAYERAMIRARLVAGRRRLIADVGYAGGPEPYGWTDRGEQAVLASVADQRDRRVEWHRIAARLNAAGHLTRNGTPWTPSHLCRTFRRAQQRGDGIQRDARTTDPVLFDQQQGAP
jgi:DNA invertase Pin-like site-specific DNA recombinase